MEKMNLRAPGGAVSGISLLSERPRRFAQLPRPTSGPDRQSAGAGYEIVFRIAKNNFGRL
ncbi:hypothetical protein C5Q97_01740 [Victivallales bacterium CCUG 44730]|nr:hypothetical protein C5Q97_01740 [Victivallales bacterium CCUG 44730]